MIEGFFLTSPNAVGLPAAERADAPTPATRAVVDRCWPQIERLLADGQVMAAIAAMESLASTMRQTTATDAPLFSEALTQARRLLYDALVQVGRTSSRQSAVRAALARCAVWDEELRYDLEAQSFSPGMDYLPRDW